MRLDQLARALLDDLPRGGILGISGPQGAGKSHLAAALVARAAAEGRRGVALSIDDFYLRGAEQDALAASAPDDPLLAVRGGPGTHDLALGLRTLAALRGEAGRAELPRYDKSARGGRGERGEPIHVDLPIDFVILEGWLLGFRPVGDSPVDRRLAPYAAWRVDRLLQLRMLDPRSVIRWRVEAEAERAARLGPDRAMDPAEARAYVERFLPLYERCSDSVPADVVAWLDPDRRLHHVDKLRP